MVLQPRLRKDEAQSLGRRYAPSDKSSPYRTWFSETALARLKRVCQEVPEEWMGVWVWPDGMAAPVPHPAEGQAFPAVLAESYEQVRSAVEREVLRHFPSNGRD